MLTEPVTLGTALYPGPLTITASGGITPTEAAAAAPLAAGWSAELFAPINPILLGHQAAATSLQGGVQEVGHSPFIPPSAALPATDWPVAGYSLRLLGIGGTI